MVAFLTKTEGNDDFADIVDFLNASSIRYSNNLFLQNINEESPKIFSRQKHTFVSKYFWQFHAKEGEGSGQPSEPQPTPSPAQSFHEEQLSDIPSSSQPQKTQKHRKGRKLSNKVLDLEKAMTAQAKEIAILKNRSQEVWKRE
ncbi:hypothetical protein Tco_1499889 [Tanacetum coccineum]